MSGPALILPSQIGKKVPEDDTGCHRFAALVGIKANARSGACRLVTRDLMNGRPTARSTWHQEQTVERQNDLTIDLAVFNGSISYAGGGSAGFALVEAMQISEVAEPFATTIIVVLPDGSVSDQSFEGKRTFRNGPSPVREGGTRQFAVMGRFLGLPGGVDLTGRQRMNFGVQTLALRRMWQVKFFDKPRSAGAGDHFPPANAR